jgi:hypothetical protein
LHPSHIPNSKNWYPVDRKAFEFAGKTILKILKKAGNPVCLYNQTPRAKPTSVNFTSVGRNPSLQTGIAFDPFPPAVGDAGR